MWGPSFWIWSPNFQIWRETTKLQQNHPEFAQQVYTQNTSMFFVVLVPFWVGAQSFRKKHKITQINHPPEHLNLFLMSVPSWAVFGGGNWFKTKQKRPTKLPQKYPPNTSNKFNGVLGGLGGRKLRKKQKTTTKPPQNYPRFVAWFARIGNSSESCESAWRAIKIGVSIANDSRESRCKSPVPLSTPKSSPKMNVFGDLAGVL